MKLLFDQNLSSALVIRLSDLFPESAHVKNLGMMRSDDVAIWTYAAQNEFTIVSKDSDFQQAAYFWTPRRKWCGSESVIVRPAESRSC